MWKISLILFTIGLIIFGCSAKQEAKNNEPDLRLTNTCNEEIDTIRLYGFVVLDKEHNLVLKDGKSIGIEITRIVPCDSGIEKYILSCYNAPIYNSYNSEPLYVALDGRYLNKRNDSTECPVFQYSFVAIMDTIGQ